MKNKIIITFFIIFWMSFLERDMNGELWKKSQMYFSEIFTGRVFFRRTCLSWSAESTNLGTFLEAWIVFFFSFFLKPFLERVWKKNSKKIPKCFSHWDLSIELFNVKFRALGGPKLRFCDFLHAQVAFSRVFCTLKIVSEEGCEGKISEKIPSVPLTEIYRLS